MIDIEERYKDTEETLRVAMDAQQAAMHTGQPGRIVSYNPATQTATVQPVVMGRITKPDGSYEYQKLPVIPDVPVAFPGGGGFTLTFPISAGDECWIAHGNRDFGAWQQSGGIQKAAETRMHDLSDAIVHVGLRSQARKLGSVSGSAPQLRADDGSCYLELSGGGIVKVVAPTKITFTTPLLEVSGNVKVVGDVVAGSNNVSLVHHKHVETGGTTNEPI